MSESQDEMDIRTEETKARWEREIQEILDAIDKHYNAEIEKLDRQMDIVNAIAFSIQFLGIIIFIGLGIYALILGEYITALGISALNFIFIIRAKKQRKKWKEWQEERGDSLEESPQGLPFNNTEWKDFK